MRPLAAGFVLFGLALSASADILAEQALLGQVQALHESGAAVENPLRCGTPLIVEARHIIRDPGLRAKLAQVLARPQLAFSYVTPSGRFRIHYDLVGRDAVNLTDGDGDRVPDYVEEAAAALDSAWHLEIEGLGYQPPPADQGLDGDEYDVYLIEEGGGYYGWTIPDQYGRTTSSYLKIDNNFTDPEYRTRGLDALRVTAAHEFFHAIQFGYYQGADGNWWQEATATWMEEVAHPEVDDYLQYLSTFLSDPERALDSPSLGSDAHVYGASLFAHFLDQRHERSLIRATWEEWGRQGNAGMEHFDRVLRRQTARGLGEAVSEFSVWNYFTGPRHRAGRFYAEGEKYPAARTRSLATPAKVAVQHRQALFPFALDRASASTWLAIFSPDGLLVRRYDLGPRAARAYTQAWDGRNEAGQLVGSGIYYGVLQAQAGSALRSLALIRD